MKTQILIVAFLIPQVLASIALYKLSDILKEPIKVELLSPLNVKLRL